MLEFICSLICKLDCGSGTDSTQIRQILQSYFDFYPRYYIGLSKSVISKDCGKIYMWKVDTIMTTSNIPKSK
jgi:hypothetical protein